MDFLKLLRSLEEFLYELCTWFLFFPRTLYRVVARSGQVSAYVLRELAEPEDRRFDDAISPPMFLMLAVLLAHGVELFMHQTVIGTNDVSRSLLGNEEALLLYRSVTFAIWPLLATVHLLRRTGSPMTRESMRHPFFAQCYLTAPFAITLSTAFVFVRMPGETSTLVGLAATAVASAWYAVTQTRWLATALGRPWLRTLPSTLWILALGALINSGIGVLLLWPGKDAAAAAIT